MEAPKLQAKLLRANIHNTAQLKAAILEYKEIYEQCNKVNPAIERMRKIKQLEAECKMQQKGDTQFTPQKLAERIVEYANINSDSIVLEPSAGIGNIADEIQKITKNIDCCEHNYNFEKLLKMKGHKVVSNDFLSYEMLDYYDAIIMNPPFTNNQDIEHLKHAYKMLKANGILVSITSSHWIFANDKKSTDFREWIEELDYTFEKVHNANFEMTNVSIGIMVIHKCENARQEIA